MNGAAVLKDHGVAPFRKAPADHAAHPCGQSPGAARLFGKDRFPGDVVQDHRITSSLSSLEGSRDRAEAETPRGR